MTSRQKKSFINANINLFFYFASAVLAFFSRKIFLNHLGDDFVGLTGTIGNLLGLMNMAELGVGSAVGISLYKPVFENDKKTINELLSVFGFLWRRIGIIIGSVAILLSLFFPIIFSSANFPLSLIFVLFYGFLLSSLLGYFFNYQQILLSSNQRNYVITLYYNSSVIIKTIFQMVLVLNYQSYFGWIFIEVVFNGIYSIILNIKIKKDYPWLNTNASNGKKLFENYAQLWKKTKEIFAHKIAHLVLNQTDQILIYTFTSLSTVAKYGNYALIVVKLGSLFDVLFNGLNAGIGNLIQESNIKKIKKVFFELNSFRFIMAGCIVIVIFFTIDHVIVFWVGEKYVMDKSTLVLILFNLYILQIISTVDLFKSSYGLFKDVWAPITEAILNLGITIVLGYYTGLNGVLLGTAISAFLMKLIWKPYYLYRYGFKEKVLEFWFVIFKYFFCLALTGIGVNYLSNSIVFLNLNKFYDFAIYSLIISTSSFLFYSALLLLIDQGYRDFVNRIYNVFKVSTKNAIKILKYPK